GSLYDEITDLTIGYYESGTTAPGAPVFFTGNTQSPNFPVIDGELIDEIQGIRDAFVLAYFGVKREWVTHYGGNLELDGDGCQSFSNAITLDKMNNIIGFTGVTTCIDFPVTDEDDDPNDDYI